jgi:DNA primase
MMRHIPNDFINELLNRTDLVELIDRHVPLKKAGANYHACCPFHAEKTPSFTVSPSKQFYHCFGCGAHGNALSFLMAYNHLEFIDAVEELANHLGLPIPRDINPVTQQRHHSLFTLLDQATHYYEQQLTQASQAKSYLKTRGLTDAIIQRFNIGFAPNAWDNLLQFLKPSPQTLAECVIAGLAIKNPKGSTYDRFRNRIIIPIKDYRGRTIGFGGRSLGDELPKYLNSPETPLFHKGSELYGLYEARQNNFNSLLVVEGYMDAIALHQFGITNVVATLGTATSARHLQRLFRYTQEVIFCFDGDHAGKEAAWRALEVSLPLLTDGLQIRFMFLANGEDPDSFVRKIGVDAFKQQIQQATPLADFFFNRLSAEINLQTLEGKAKLAQSAQELLYKLPEGIFQSLMLEKLATMLGMSIATLNSHYEQNRPEPSSLLPKSEIKPLSPMQLTIALLLQYPELAKLDYLPRIPPDTDLKGITILHKLLNLIMANPNATTGSLVEQWRDTKAASHLGNLASRDLLAPTKEIQEKLLLDALNKILAFSLEQKIQVLEEKNFRGELSAQNKEFLLNLYKERILYK